MDIDVRRLRLRPRPAFPLRRVRLRPLLVVPRGGVQAPPRRLSGQTLRWVVSRRKDRCRQCA
eukprot:176714-Alexandrium_andersonii.AAC.1